MARVYVAGPVMRGDHKSWVTDVYEIARREAAGMDAEAVLPESESRLESLEPRPFFDEMLNRVRSSDVGVILFAAPDPSAAIEATLLAGFEKPVLVIARDPKEVPRLLRGLPSVARVVTAESPEVVREAIRDFFEDNLRAHGAKASW